MIRLPALVHAVSVRYLLGFLRILIGVVNVPNSKPYSSEFDYIAPLKFESAVGGLSLEVSDDVPKLFLRVLVEMGDVHLVLVVDPVATYDG